MIVVPGTIGITVPISPRAISTIANSHQNASMGLVNRDPAMVNRQLTIQPIARSYFDPRNVDLILKFRYATHCWNKSSGFHSAHQNVRWAEANHLERKFRQTKHFARIFPNGVYQHLHDGNVWYQLRPLRLR